VVLLRGEGGRWCCGCRVDAMVMRVFFPGDLATCEACNEEVALGGKKAV
jgi:hypothetical protein